MNINYNRENEELRQIMEAHSKEQIVKCILEKASQSEELRSLFLSTFQNSPHIRLKKNKTLKTLIERKEWKEITFQEILDDPFLCSGFRKFCAKIFCEENIMFYNEVRQFKLAFSSLPPHRRFLVAKKIFETFITDRSAHELNLNDDTKKQITQIFEVEMKNHDINNEALQSQQCSSSFIKKEIFENAETEIYQLMLRDSFPKFMKHAIGKETFDNYTKIRNISSTLLGEYAIREVELLSEYDWNLLFSSSVNIEVNAGDVLVDDAAPSNYMYMLLNGDLTMAKRGVQIAKIRENGTIIGEFGLLGNFHFSSQIYASKKSKLLRAELRNVIQFMTSHPILALKFFKQMAIKLTNILLRLSQNQKSLQTNDTSYMTSSSSSAPNPLSSQPIITRNEDEFVAAFPRLKDFGVLIDTIEGNLEKKVISHRGKLFITKNYLCFHSSIFGQKIIEVIPFSEIEIVKRKKNQKLKIRSSTQQMTFKLKSEEESDLAEKTISSLIKTIDASPSHQISSSKPLLSLTSDDWDILLSGSISHRPLDSKKWIMEFKRGEAIITEGQEYNFLCQIQSGSCRVEKAGKQILLTTGEIVGEVTFINESKASASVYANEDIVSLYVINGAFVKGELSETNPLVVSKFYRYLCTTLAHRIDEHIQ